MIRKLCKLSAKGGRGLNMKLERKIRCPVFFRHSNFNVAKKMTTRINRVVMWPSIV